VVCAGVGTLKDEVHLGVEFGGGDVRGGCCGGRVVA
jgi:hypothetical protein